MKQVTSAIFIAMILVILPVNLPAIDLGPDQSSASLKYGTMSAGDRKETFLFDAPKMSRTRETGWLGVAFDYPIARNLYLGAAVDMSGHAGIELGVSLKGLIASNNGKFAVRPGVGVGGAASGNTELLTVRAFTELQVSVSRQFGVGLEAGIWYTPSGGDDMRSIRIGPLTYIRGMVLFSSGQKQSYRPVKTRHDPLPFSVVVKAGSASMTNEVVGFEQNRKWTDRGVSFGITADSPTPLLGFLGATFDWHSLGNSESLSVYGLRGSVISEIPVGKLRFRPVGMIGVGTMHSGHTAYGVSLESFWDTDAGHGWLLEIQYLKLSQSNVVVGVKLKPLVIIRAGVTF